MRVFAIVRVMYCDVGIRIVLEPYCNIYNFSLLLSLTPSLWAYTSTSLSVPLSITSISLSSFLYLSPMDVLQLALPVEIIAAKLSSGGYRPREITEQLDHHGEVVLEGRGDETRRRQLICRA